MTQLLAAFLLSIVVYCKPPVIAPLKVNVEADATCRLLTESFCTKDAFCRWDYRADVYVHK